MMKGFPNSDRILLTPQVRQCIRRYKIVDTLVGANAGIGERRSRSKGEGIEFEDFRPYASGDDMRRLDPHIYLRLGQPVIRQFAVSRQLAVTVLVDLSASMGFGSPSKSSLARALAAGLSLCALTAGDSVHCGVLQADDVEWFPRIFGSGRFEELQAWLISLDATGAHDLVSPIARISQQLNPGISFLISDLWTDEAEKAISLLLAAKQDVVVIRVLAPEELDPSDHMNGMMRLIDSETGDEVEVDIDGSTLALYADRQNAHAEQLRDYVLRHKARLVNLTSDVTLLEAFERHLHHADVIR